MNQAAKDALRKAWLDGVRQIKGGLYDGEGFCALGVLWDLMGRPSTNLDKDMNTRFGLCADPKRCPNCGYAIGNEFRLIIHMNDEHGFDFAKIAGLMPDDEVAG